LEKGRGDKKGTYPKHGECEREEKVHDSVAAINGLSIDVCWEKNEINRRCCAITQTHPVKSYAKQRNGEEIARVFGGPDVWAAM
jgi:3'-phosphoadenosine 5'-phosphosulfate sulfotransferase (PAPS reductase)/FAD synthetase